MKVLMISTVFPNTRENFNGISIYQTVEKLLKLGVEFKVVVPVEKSPIPLRYFKKWKSQDFVFPEEYALKNLDVEFYRFNMINTFITYSNCGSIAWALLRRRFIKEINKFKPDLIWCQPALPCGWISREISKITGIPFVIVVHGVDIDYGIHIPKVAEKLANIYRSAAKVISVSSRNKEGVLLVAPEIECEVIPNGTDLKRFEGVLERQKNGVEKSSEYLTIVSASYLKKRKAIDFNIHALNILRDQIPELKYRIVGDGEEKKVLEELVISLNLGDRITFLGKLDYESTLNEIAQADIFCLASYKEGFGLVYLEAMVLGIPTIGCAGQGVRDIIDDGKNGFLVKPKDSEAIASIWRKLSVNKDLRKRIGEAGRITVHQKFLWDGIAKKYFDVFQGIIDND